MKTAQLQVCPLEVNESKEIALYYLKSDEKSKIKKFNKLFYKNVDNLTNKKAVAHEFKTTKD